ncbi:MAG: amidohydrolase family protein, partial [Gammaproteobacteria bacterium]
IRAAIAAGADSIEHATFVDDETLALLRRRGVFIVPTLTNTYRVTTDGERGGVAPYIVKTASSVFPTMLASAGRAIRAGVRMALGTDAGSWLNPHTDLTTEIRLRVEAGATPLTALSMATLLSAQCMGLEADLGSLEPGKIADIVVLDGDPLMNFTAYERIHRVFKSGEPVDGEEPQS